MLKNEIRDMYVRAARDDRKRFANRSVVNPPKARPLPATRKTWEEHILMPKVLEAFTVPVAHTPKIVFPVELLRVPDGTLIIPAEWKVKEKKEYLRRIIRSSLNRLRSSIAVLEQDYPKNARIIRSHKRVVLDLLHLLT
jgi:hypothetical protein